VTERADARPLRGRRRDGEAARVGPSIRMFRVFRVFRVLLCFGGEHGTRRHPGAQQREFAARVRSQ
jgi:hypothetical protein